MDILVSILGSRNLSHSSLIMRNLFSTIQVAEKTHSCQQVEADEIPFRAVGMHEMVTLTLRNGQTQTVMFVRNIPVDLLAGHQQAVTMWVAVYPPGDPRDLAFDSTPPKPEVPQVQLSLRLAQHTAVSSPLSTSPQSSLSYPRRSTRSPPPQAEPFSSRGHSSSNFTMEQIAALERAEDIKLRISASAAAQRKAQSAEQRLAEAQQEIESLRARLNEAEEEVRVLSARRAAAEREKQEAREASSRARETLRLRDLSILEFRNTRDEADRQLSQVIAERESKRADMDASLKNFDAQVRGLAAELERNRAEAGALSEALQKCDRRALEMGAIGAAGVASSSGESASAELLDLRRQLAEANDELERVRSQAAAQAERAGQTEEQLAAGRARLGAAEAAAAEARRRLGEREVQMEEELRRSMELRVAADDAERELVAQASRAAQLDGQVSENRNQLRELQGRVREVAAQVERHEAARAEVAATVARLRDQLAEQELESERIRGAGASLESRLREVQEEVRRWRQRAAEMQGKRQESEDGRSGPRTELDSTRRVLETVLRSTSQEVIRLRAAIEGFSKDAARLQAQVQDRERGLAEAESAAQAAAHELPALSEERGRLERERREAEERVAALQQSKAPEAVLAEARVKAQAANTARDSAVAALEAQQATLLRRQEAAAALGAEVAELREEEAQVRRKLQEAREAAAKQSEEVAVLRESLERQRAAAVHAGSSPGPAEAERSPAEAEPRAKARELEEAATAAAAFAARLLVGDATAAEMALEETIAVRRRHVSSAEGELERSRGDGNDVSRQLEAVAGIAEAMLEPLQAAVDRTRRLKQECEAAEATQREARQERARILMETDAELGRTLGSVEQLNAELASARSHELEQCVERIGKLEKEVSTVTARLEALRGENRQLELQLNETAAQEDGFKTVVTAQLVRAADLQRDQQAADQRVRAARERCAAAEKALQEAEEEALRAGARVEELAKEKTALVATSLREEEARKQRISAALGAVQAEERRRDEVVVLAEKLRVQQAEAQASKEAAEQALADAQRRHEELTADLSIAREELLIVQSEGRSLAEEAARRAANLEQSRRELLQPQPQEGEDERKVELLKEQLQDLAETQVKARGEAAFLEGVKEELALEQKRLREEMHIVAEKLGLQVEHGNLQYTTIEKLEEDIRRVEEETEEITLSLHEADLQHEVLLKEHELLRQRAEGRYRGTLEDFASEVHHVRAAAEEEKLKDELAHWTQAAMDAEQEKKSSMEALKKQLSIVESPLAERLRDLQAELERKAKDFEHRFPEVSGTIHSIPSPLHGVLEPSRPSPPPGSMQQRALVVGCNYSKSHAPLAGCANDAWNVQCLLRHSLRYNEDQVLSLIDCSDACPTPPSRQPTKANILAGLRWLTKGANAGDSLSFFFSGYGTQQPLMGPDGLHQGCLVPMDFAEDLPPGYFASNNSNPQAPKEGATNRSASYRLVPMAEVTSALRQLPAGCKVTIVMDCCHAVVPNMAAIDSAPYAFPRTTLEVPPEDVLELRGGPGGPRPWRPRLLDLPPLPTPPPPAVAAGTPGPPECRCHCYAACRSEQWCAELPIEGCVQGAFMWAFVKALVADGFNATVHQHMNSMRSILGNLRAHFRWLCQTPALQLSGAASMHDTLLAL